MSLRTVCLLAKTVSCFNLDIVLVSDRLYHMVSFILAFKFGDGGGNKC